MMNSKWLVVALLLALVLWEADAKRSRKQKKKKSKGKPLEFSANGPFFSLPLTVGSTKTNLRVGVDGYYGASLVYGTGVACDGMDPYCVDHATFDQTQSSTFKPANPGRHFEFSLGTADGPSGSDDIAVGSLKLKQAMFGIANSIPRHMNRKCKTSGFLAMNAPETDPMEKTTMQLVVEQASDPKITFYAPADMNAQHTITIGKEDTKNCKNNWITFKNMKSVDPQHKPWTIQWQGFKWGAYSKMETMNVAMNTAADYFVAPRRHANYIYKQLGANYNSQYSGGMVDCSKRNSAPNLEFTVPGGKKLTVTPKHYIKMFDSSNCLINIYPDDLEQWTMPYMFHQKYCVKYDYGKQTVSIADPMHM